jgi:energy-coupling factor transport system permease protein
MSQFEFMRNVTFGQYLPLDSFLHRSDPRARLLAYLLILAAITITAQWQGLIFGLLMVLIGLRLGKISPLYAMRGLIPPLPFLVILVILQLFTFPSTTNSPIIFSFWIISITTSQINAAVLLFLRFCCLVTGISLASLSLSSTQLIQALRILLTPLTWTHIPIADFILMVQVTLHFVPLSAMTAERIAKAQASRGANWGSVGFNIIKQVRQYIPILVPLFITSLRRAETVAIAMQARGYGSSTRPTSMAEFRLRITDYLLVGFSAAAAVLIITLNLHPWTN